MNSFFKFKFDFQDQLQTAKPVGSGMGMTLLQKMGWKPGEGLGKNKEGCQEPLQLEVKMDRKGKLVHSICSSIGPYVSFSFFFSL